MDDWQPAQSAPAEFPVADDSLRAESLARVQLALVESVGRVAANVGAEPPRVLQEQAARRVDRLRVAEEVLQRRLVSTFGMCALNWLLELLGIPEQNEVSRGDRNR